MFSADFGAVPPLLHLEIYPDLPRHRCRGALVDLTFPYQKHPTKTRYDPTRQVQLLYHPFSVFCYINHTAQLQYYICFGTAVKSPQCSRKSTFPRLETSQSSHLTVTRIQGSPKQKLKSSVQRSLRQGLLDTYPLLNPYIDEILPKKASLSSMKLTDRNTLYVLDSTPLFYQQDLTGILIPHLRLVHRFPQAFPSIRIDRGAIRFVLSGATLMAPGLTSPGGRLPADGAPEGLQEGKEMDQKMDEEGRWSRELVKGEPVVVIAEGKEEACAVGTLVVGTKEVKAKGKGPVIEDAHYLGDGLWNLSTE